MWGNTYRFNEFQRICNIRGFRPATIIKHDSFIYSSGVFLISTGLSGLVCLDIVVTPQAVIGRHREKNPLVPLQLVVYLNRRISM
jgi:hypothetical protein